MATADSMTSAVVKSYSHKTIDSVQNEGMKHTSIRITLRRADFPQKTHLENFALFFKWIKGGNGTKRFQVKQLHLESFQGIEFDQAHLPPNTVDVFHSLGQNLGFCFS